MNAESGPISCSKHGWANLQAPCPACRDERDQPKPSAGGVKHDQEKPDMSLLSGKALFKVAEVMTFGKKKYSAHNWRKGIGYSRLLSAAMRHLHAYNDGESLDPETGKSHLAHLGCCVMMLLEQEETRPDLDDRYKAEAK